MFQGFRWFEHFSVSGGRGLGLRMRALIWARSWYQEVGYRADSKPPQCWEAACDRVAGSIAPWRAFKHGKYEATKPTKPLKIASPKTL